uniref:Protein AHNAK2 n=1 Tax=Nothoprocta perdicaria TaxID=30464 RepID=A0A8C7EAA1_NOTPE
MGVSLAKADFTLPSSEDHLQDVVLKSSPAKEVTGQKTGIRFPKGEISTVPKSPETGSEGSSIVDGRKMKLECAEGKSKIPKIQKPKFGISLTKVKGTEPDISSSKTEAELSQMTTEIADIDLGVPASEFKSHISDPGMEAYAGRIVTPQVLTAGTEAHKIDINLQSVTTSVTEGAIETPEEKDIKLKEHEIRAQVIQNEDHQGWFKMPKFRIPSFGRTSLKEKKGDADVERSLEKPQVDIPCAKIQTEINIPENTLSLPHAATEITVGREDILKLGGSVKSSDVSLSKMEGNISLSAERTESKVDIPKTETYADVVKHSTEGQKMHTSEYKVSSGELSKTEISVLKIDKDSPNKFPIYDLALQEHQVKAQDIEIPKVESSMEFETSRVEFKPSLAEMNLYEKWDKRDPKADLVIHVGTVDKSEDDLEVNIKIPKLKIPRFTFKTFPTEAHVSAKSKILMLSEPDIKTAQMSATIDSSVNVGQGIHWSYVGGQEIHEKVEPEHVAIERCEIYSAQILKESEILSSEVKTATLGFSLLKVKLPESHSNLDVLVQQSSAEYKTDVSVGKPDESVGAPAQRTGSEEVNLSEKTHIETEECSGPVSIGIGLPKLETYDVAEALDDAEKGILDQKEKTDSKRSPGRFKFWLPNIGFSSSSEETSSDLKTEAKKSVPEDKKPANTLESDDSKQTEKPGWFRFPKLGFTSPSKKAKIVDKEEETGHKDRRSSDEDSPSDKPDIFFDAQESLSAKETITESEKNEIVGTSSDVPVSQNIVTSSARTELILLEEEKRNLPYPPIPPPPR